MDLVVSHINEPVDLVRNVAETENHWLGAQLQGKDHADVVGAHLVLEVGGREMHRFAMSGGSYASSGDRRLVFGLAGAKEGGKLKVIWPNQEVQYWDLRDVDCYYRLVQGKADAEKINAAKK
jgi:hypothetical protein